MIRRIWVLIIISAAALAGCTLARRSEQPPPVVVTATLPEPVIQAMLAPTVTPTDVPTSTPTDVPTSTPLPTATTPPVFVPPPTFTPLPSPAAQAAARPPTTRPIDDGSGHGITGTGSDSPADSLIPDVGALPAPLYYLGYVDGVAQVWRLRYGLPYPDQLSRNPAGVAAFDVAPDGVLAYIGPDGQMIIAAIPFLPPAGADGVLPQVRALAWSPDGGWLAYTLITPGADPVGGEHPVDGLWIRDRNGDTTRLRPAVYATDGSGRVFVGPLAWRPDGEEILTGYQLAEGFVFGRVNIDRQRFRAVWNDFVLPPDSFREARWTADGSALIFSGGLQILRVDPHDLSVAQTLVDTDAGLEMSGATLLPDGTLVFVGSPLNPSPAGPPTGPRRLYRIAPGQGAPLYTTDSLTEQGSIDLLWDETGRRALLVVYEPGAWGIPYLRDADGALIDLTALTGPMLSPRWGPMFQANDTARIHTVEGDTLNLRSTPGGEVITRLADGQRVRVLGDTRVVDAYRWWQVQTVDALTGWVVESVIDPEGQRLYTLLPVE